MHCINRVELLGYLGRDPEFAKNQSGMSICTLSLGTSSDRQTSPGVFEKVTEWSRVILFRTQADNAARFLRKGSLVLVTGRLQTRKYHNRNNQLCYATEIIASDFIMFGGGDRDREGTPSGEGGSQSADSKAALPQCPELDLSDMPF